MRGPGRGGQRAGRHISISATDAEWETVRRHARRRGLSMSRYLVGLAERGGAEEIAGPAVALTRGEQRELLAALRALRAAAEAGPSGSRNRRTRRRREGTARPPGRRRRRWRR